MTNTVELGTSAAGAGSTDLLLTYLARLTGEPLTAATPVQLRSVHRAALTSWARKQGVPVRLSVLSAGTPFTVGDLLGAEGAGAASAPATAAMTQPVQLMAGAGGQALAGLGVDIEEVESLPKTADFREHSFFQDNFTPAEIAHAIRQGDARASLCGIWAAKEAVLKAGLATKAAGSLKAIEITWDAAGRPVYPGAQLSVSHTPRTAVAMCMAVGSPVPVAAPPVAAMAERLPARHTAEPVGKPGRWPWSRNKA